MKLKNTAKIVVFCIIFLFLLNRIYEIFSWKDTAGDYLSSMESFYDLDNNMIEVVFLGNSHCYCSVIPAQLWEDYGMASFNMAISGQDMAGSYYNMKEALKTQDLKVICLDLYGCTFHGYEIEGNLFRSTLSRKLSITSLEAVNSMVEGDDKANHIIKWPIIHTRYREVQKEDFLKERPVYLGYRSEFKTTPVERYVYSHVEPQPFGGEEQEYLKKIIALAKETETELVFFLAPYQIPLKSQEYIAYAKEMAKEHGIPVIDMVEMSDEVGLDWDHDFIDYGHTNYFGAQKVTKYLGTYLKENYELQNYRGDERYALWDEDLEVRQHEVLNYQLVQICDMKSYFETISHLEDYTIIVSTTGEYLSESGTIEEYLQLLGTFAEFYDGNTAWVFDNKENVYVSKTPEDIKALELSYGELLISSTEGRTDVLVDRANNQKVENGVNVLIYDNLLGRVVDCVGFDAQYGYGMVR